MGTFQTAGPEIKNFGEREGFRILESRPLA